jgi:hypothetical protein
VNDGTNVKPISPYSVVLHYSYNTLICGLAGGLVVKSETICKQSSSLHHSVIDNALNEKCKILFLPFHLNSNRDSTKSHTITFHPVIRKMFELSVVKENAKNLRNQNFSLVG